MREFRITKETRGEDCRYFPQFRWKRWSGMWWFNLIDGGNNWQYWIGTPTWVGEYTSFIPVMFKAQAEAQAFIDRQAAVDDSRNVEVVACQEEPK